MNIKKHEQDTQDLLTYAIKQIENGGAYTTNVKNPYIIKNLLDHDLNKFLRNNGITLVISYDGKLTIKRD